MTAPPPPLPPAGGGGGTLQSHPHLTSAATLATLAAAAFTLHTFPPTTSSFYPPCPIHLYTGLLCPGCGATRALAALTHGDLPAALHFNALITLLLPCAAAYALFLYLRALRSPHTRHQPIPIPIPISMTAALLAVTAVFTIVRNLS